RLASGNAAVDQSRAAAVELEPDRRENPRDRAARDEMLEQRLVPAAGRVERRDARAIRLALEADDVERAAPAPPVVDPFGQDAAHRLGAEKGRRPDRRRELEQPALVERAPYPRVLLDDVE